MAHDSGEFSFIPPHPGAYYVNVYGNKDKQIAVASFFVLPEVPGTVVALGAGIAAFGIVKINPKETSSLILKIFYLNRPF